MKNEELNAIFKDINCKKKFNEPMRDYTSFRIGGNADLLIFPEDIDDLRNVFYICRDKKIPLFVIGFGTNLLIRDGGIRGAVISLDKGFKEIRIAGDEMITAGAGAGLQVLVNFALKNELSGMEFAVGIPGSVGGAVIMNAGTRDGEMKDVVKSVKVMTDGGEIKVLKREDIGFSYRHSDFPSGSVVLETDVILKKGDRRDIKKKMELFIADRKLKQPLSSHSAGSVFKNPIGDAETGSAQAFAGRLIESAGFKGFSVGDAAVSEKHANFIVNKGNATAKDVLRLIEIIKEKVFAKTGIFLEEEIEIVGED